MKLFWVKDGIFESKGSFPTPAERELGLKMLQSKIKAGSKAAAFLGLDDVGKKVSAKVKD